MTTQISIESIALTVHQNTPVISTELLAQLYGTDTANIKMNFSRNQDRFVEGKHFYKLLGEELKMFKDKVTQSYLVAPRAKHLILWTERGAARHAKMLETDQAWEVFEKLEDCYFGSSSPAIKPLSSCTYDTRTLCYKRNGVTVNEIPLQNDELVITLESWVQLAQNNGWVVMRQEELIDKLVRGIERSLVKH